MAQPTESGQRFGRPWRIPPPTTPGAAGFVLSGQHRGVVGHTRRRMTVSTGRDLVNAQVAIESFSLSSDGSFIVYAVRRVRRGEYVSHLYRVAWSGGRSQELTSGRVRDTAPVIAPDGQSVAFVRTAVGKDHAQGQLWILPLRTGGRPWQLTRQEHGAGTPRWSPDGSRLAFLGQAGEDRFVIGPARRKRSPLARRITRTDFRDDDSGLLSRRTHLWSIEVRRGARPTQLTDGDFDVTEPSWAPDGSWLAFTADIEPDVNILPRDRIFRVAARGGTHRPVAALAGHASAPAISPDGRQLAFIGSDIEDPHDEALTGLWVKPVRGGAARRVGADLDRSIGNGAWADLVMADDAVGPVWLADGSLLAMVGDSGRNLPYRFTLDGGCECLLAPDQVVGAGLAVAGDRIAVSAGRGGHAAELFALESWLQAPGRLRRLTTIGSGWQRRFGIPGWEEHWIDGPGGPIQAWVVSPAGVANTPMPTIVDLHGGPTGCAGPGGTMDSTLLTGHGYRVVRPNVRGSDTFGSAWIRALGGRWGEVDAGDVEAVVAGLVAKGLVDPRRVGVMGLSYGGFLTQWLAGTSRTFGAAVAENGVSNQVSTWATSYFGIHYNRRARLGDPLSEAGLAQLWRTSPLRHASTVSVPLLMLQAEEDQVCPTSDNLQLFTALKVLGREVELILYPEEHHEMKNYGRPDRRVDRMDRILEWFDRHLRAGPPAGGAKVRRATSG
jgi:dipeptidyl aminopeptidase/acylaminoacyl peptidase